LIEPLCIDIAHKIGIASNERLEAAEDAGDLGPPPSLAGLGTMLNVGFLLSGYNLMLGNPVPTSESGVLTSDPGFRLPIFVADFSEGQTTQDLRYVIPSGLAV
jgi:hypothetical protein